MANDQVARNIHSQIGAKAMYMIGAKNLAFDEKSLTFKVMQNAKKVTHVKIELNSMGTYDVLFLNCRGLQAVIKEEVKGAYDTMLRPLIEKYTGLYTNI